jgi:diguanylate cyclase (GGDEF)-like protein/PAS domain S-box-containing protein
MQPTADVGTSAAGINPSLVTIFNSMMAGVLVSTPDGRPAFANAAAARLLGASSPGQAPALWTELISTGAARDAHGATLGPSDMPTVRVAEGAESAETTMLLRAADGVERWLSVRALPLPDAREPREFIVTGLLDVSSQQRTAQERDRFFDLSLDLIAVTAFDGRLLRASASFALILGYDPDTLAGRNVIEFVHPDDLAAAHAVGDAVRAGTAVHGATSRWRQADGSYRWIEWTAVAGPDETAYNIGRDVSERIAADAAQAARLRQQEALTEIARLATVEGDLTALLDRTCQIVAVALNVELCTVVELEENGEWLRVVAGHHADPSIMALRGQIVQPRAGAPAGRAIDTDQPVAMDDVSVIDGLALTPVHAALGIKGTLCAPVGGVEGPFGALSALSTRPRRYTDDEIAFLRVVAGIAGATIERVRRAKELADSERRYRTIVHTAAEGIWTVDAEGLTTFVNPKMAAMLGYAPEELIGRSLLDFMNERARAMIAGQQSRRAQGISDTYELPLLRRDGSELWTAVTATPQFDDEGHYCGALAMLTDITVRRDAERFKHGALHDSLTDLPNRVLFADRLAHALDIARRRGERCALLQIDLDGFKPVNDTYGHRAGDRALQEVARRLRASLRDSDTAARIGGDEFAVVLPAASRQSATAVARKLATAIAAPVTVGGGELRLGASIGVAVYPENGLTAVALSEAADAAMYAAKRERRGIAAAGTRAADTRVLRFPHRKAE